MCVHFTYLWHDTKDYVPLVLWCLFNYAGGMCQVATKNFYRVMKAIKGGRWPDGLKPLLRATISPLYFTLQTAFLCPLILQYTVYLHSSSETKQVPWWPSG